MSVAYIVDDDEHFLKAMKILLGKLSIEVRGFSQSVPFLQAIKKELPDFCFIDLNIDQVNEGFLLVQAIRRQLPAKIPLFVTSGRKDNESIAHAIEIGATDYLVKPVDLEMLGSKLMPYARNDETRDADLLLHFIPEDGDEVAINFSYEISAIDEFGIVISGSALFSKRSMQKIEGKIIEEAIGTPGAQLMKVNNCWADPDANEFHAYLEFENLSQEESSHLRGWLERFCDAQ